MSGRAVAKEIKQARGREAYRHSHMASATCVDICHVFRCVVDFGLRKTGFAGIDNDLFYDPKATMLFGDAKERALQKLVTAVGDAGKGAGK